MILISEGDPDNYLQLINQYLAILGSIASIIGLVITFLVWRGVNKIKEAYVSKAIAPRRIDELKDIRQRCHKLLDGQFSVEDENRMAELLTEARTIAENLSQKMKQINRKEYENTILPKFDSFERLHREYKRKSDKDKKDDARAAINKLLEFIRSSELLFEDETWRRIE